MQKMQREWREEEKRRKEKMEEEGGLDEDGDEEEGMNALLTKKKTKKGKRKRDGAEDSEEHDIWASIKAKPISSLDPQRGLVGLHDVVQAPPKLTKGKMKVREDSGSGFGKIGNGGMKREGELREARRGVVEGYRVLMREGREGTG